MQLYHFKAKAVRAYNRARRCGSLCSVLSTAFVVARVLVVFLQAVASIRSEREADDELHQLCTNGEGRASAKMRHACLTLAAERASPVLIAAIARTPALVVQELSATFSLSRASVLAGACVLILFAPYAMMARRYIVGGGQRVEGCCDDDGRDGHVVLIGGGNSGEGRWRGTLRRLALRSPRRRSMLTTSLCEEGISDDDPLPSIEEVAESEENGWPGCVAAQFAGGAWRAIPIGKRGKLD